MHPDWMRRIPKALWMLIRRVNTRAAKAHPATILIRKGGRIKTFLKFCLPGVLGGKVRLSFH